MNSWRSASRSTSSRSDATALVSDAMRASWSALSLRSNRSRRKAASWRERGMRRMKPPITTSMTSVKIIPTMAMGSMPAPRQGSTGVAARSVSRSSSGRIRSSRK